MIAIEKYNTSKNKHNQQLIKDFIVEETNKIALNLQDNHSIHKFNIMQHNETDNAVQSQAFAMIERLLIRI